MDFVVDNWDDLRLFLRTVRAGSIAAAARELRVDPTTISRRMAAFEESLGTKLFDRLKGGVVLSPTGETILEGAAQAEDAIRRLERVGASQEDALRGTVRIAVAELLALGVADKLAHLSERYPTLSIQMVCGDEMHNLSRREADIALCATESPPLHLVGRRVGHVETAVYVGTALGDVTVETVPWIGWSGLEDHEGVVGQMRHSIGGEGPFAIHADSYGLVLEFARRGVGATVLPRVLGDSDPSLVRLSGARVIPIPLWVLTHPDLRHTPRIKTILGELAAMFKSLLAERDTDK